jgi:hypothetical protein
MKKKVLPASRSFLKSVRRNLPPHPSRPPVTLTAHLRLKGPWMRFDASERPRCTALHCHQTCGRRFREDSAHHHAGTAVRGLSHFAILGRHCLCVARHERGRANAYRRHQSRNALQNSFSPSRRDILYRLHPHHCNAKGFATLPSTCASASVPPACPEAGQSANMCKRPPFEARGRTMIRDGSGEGSTLLTLLKNIQ